MVMTSIRLREDTLQYMRDLAKERHVPYSEIIREALTRMQRGDAIQDPLRLAVVDTSKDNAVVGFPV